MMNIVNYETIIFNNKLSNKIDKLKFANTIWISSSDVFFNLFTWLIKENYDRDFHINIFMYMKTNKKVCKIHMYYNVLLLKYNLISQKDLNKHANCIYSRKFTTTKTTSRFWHLKLDYCRLEIIHQLKKVDDVEMIKKDKSSKTIDCET
jgi:hypothetical protein